MSALFKQNDFSGGLNTQLDATKIPSNAYALLINGRTRRNVIEPTARHVRLNAPAGRYQGLYIVGSFLIIFVYGIAYYADITESPIIFRQVGGWQPFSITTPRIYAEQVPANSNLFNRRGPVDETTKIFNSSIAVTEQALFCFDGVSRPQAILPDGNSVVLSDYNDWTQDNPEYVPIGVLPAFCSNKLFLADPDRQKIYHSVSGRAADFVVNIDADGNKGGDAATVATAIGLNKITSIRSLSTGQVLVGTLYGTHILTLDPTQPIFGEPYLIPEFLFPAGPLNEISIVDILKDTAFITQSGIHAFNVVAQAKRESNNYPLGAKIRGLITDPITGKAITQIDTCAGLYDDYAFFAVNTIFGYGCLVYDTNAQAFQSLDLSFGRVKQFATTKLDGSERLFYITHDNEIFEAFAGSENKNVTRIYCGEWTPEEACANLQSHMVDLIFSTVRTSGQVKISVYSDKELVDSGVIEVTAPGFNAITPMPIPGPNAKQTVPVSYQTGQIRGWKLGILVEWNFDGQLTDISLDGKMDVAENADLDVQVAGDKEKFTFTADSGYGTELNTGGSFPSGFRIVNVTKGSRYVFEGNGNGPLVNGAERLLSGIFTAADNTVVVKGTGAATFALRLAEPTMKVFDAMVKEAPDAIFHGGDFAYPHGTEMDVKLAMMPLRLPFYCVPGNHDLETANGKFFFAALGQPRYFHKAFKFVDVFFMDGNSSEPDGIDINSKQAAMIKDWAAHSTKPFKIVILHQAPYSNDQAHTPGEASLRYLNATLGISAVISGHAHNMERFVVNSFPYFVCGAGGHSLRGFAPIVTAPAFAKAGTLGYLVIEADALTCRITFKDVNGNILDSYAIYA